MGKGKIPASIEMADLENYAQWRERTFCEDKSKARNEVAKKWGLRNWEELVNILKSRQVPAAPKRKPGGAVAFELCFSRHEMFQALRKAGFDAEPYRRLEERLGDERAQCEEALTEDFARVITNRHTTGIRFGDFVDQTTNKIMATSPMVKDVIWRLCQTRDFEVICPSGCQKRTNNLSNDDIILPRRQLILPALEGWPPI